MTLSEVLSEAAKLLGQGWSVVLPANGEGIYCDAFDPRCAAWDLHGALLRASSGDPNLWCDAMTLLDEMTPRGSAQLFEEEKGRTQAEVVRLVQRGAQRAWRAEQSEAA